MLSIMLSISLVSCCACVVQVLGLCRKLEQRQLTRPQKPAAASIACDDAVIVNIFRQILPISEVPRDLLIREKNTHSQRGTRSSQLTTCNKYMATRRPCNPYTSYSWGSMRPTWHLSVCCDQPKTSLYVARVDYLVNQRGTSLAHHGAMEAMSTMPKNEVM